MPGDDLCSADAQEAADQDPRPRGHSAWNDFHLELFEPRGCDARVLEAGATNKLRPSES